MPSFVLLNQNTTYTILKASRNQIPISVVEAIHWATEDCYTIALLEVNYGMYIPLSDDKHRKV